MDRSNWEENLYYAGRSRGVERGAAGFLWLMFFAAVALIGCVVMSRGEAPDLPQYIEFPPKKGHYWMVPLRVIDGDTIEFGLVAKVDRGRLRDIDTPEDDTEAGKAATKYLSSIVEIGKATPGRIFGNDKYGYEIDMKGSHGYWLCQSMLETRHAKIWPGGRGPKPFPKKGEKPPN